MKKILLRLLILCMIACSALFVLTACDNGNAQSDAEPFMISTTCTLVGVKDKTVTEIVVPDYVTSIGESAFYNCSNLKSITIPESVTSIGYNAFCNCSSLISINIPSSVKYIGERAFYNCSSLTSMSIPFVGDSRKTLNETYKYPFGYIFGTSSYIGGTATIQYYYDSSTALTNKTYYIPSSLKTVTVTEGNIVYGAFYNCTGLTSVILGNDVTNIGAYAFYGCTGLTSMTIPNSVMSIDGGAFSGCSSLQEITIPFVGAKAGVTSSNTYQYPFGYIFGTSSYTGGQYIQQYYYGNSTSSTTNTIYSIPTSLTKVTVTGGNILYGAFYNCSGLTNITISNSITSIGACAFYGCTGLKSITIPNSVTLIGNSAFNNCTSLQYNAYNNAYYIGNQDNPCLVLIKAKSTDITYCYIHNTTKIVYRSAFNGCTGLTGVIIPNSVTSIDNYAFYNCSGLTSVTFENTSGWFMTGDSTATSGTAMDVTKPTTNATNLKSNYYSYYWKRG